MVRHWIRLPRAGVDPTSLGMFKKYVDVALGHMRLGSAGLVVELMISGSFSNLNDPMFL